MRNTILNVIILAFVILFFSIKNCIAQTYNDKMFTAEISVTEQVPIEFYGTWRVSSILKNTNNIGMFKKKNADIWNISKSDNVIKISNPFSGAEAEVDIEFAENQHVKFTKKTSYENRILYDTVDIIITKNKFQGENILKLDKLSDVDKSVIKTFEATYNLKGEKISEY